MPRISTPLADRIGLKYPIVCAPMFIVSNKEMIVAAAEAGILGCMPSLNARTAEKLREDLAWIRQRTDKAFGINITIGLTAPERVEADMALRIEFGVPVILTSYGNPTALVKQAHEHKRLVFHDVIGLAHGRKAVAAGVDGIIAVSAGAGGHALHRHGLAHRAERTARTVARPARLLRQSARLHFGKWRGLSRPHRG